MLQYLVVIYVKKSEDNSNKIQADVVIIGAGASGCVAAISAARKGANVVLIDHNDRIGKKILATGNGKCNYSNESQGVSNYYGSDPAFVMPVFEAFSFEDTRNFFGELGIEPLCMRGGYYPNSQQAASILEVLELEIRRLHIKKILNEAHITITKPKTQFELQLSYYRITTNNLIVACGGQASASTGSDGSGYEYARQFGHNLIATVPALVPLIAQENYYKELAGIRTQGVASIYIDGQYIAKEGGELQLTANGVSGIPIFQISRFASYGIENHKKTEVFLDFCPQQTTKALHSHLQQRFANSTDKTMEEAMIGLLHRKLSTVLLQLSDIQLQQKASTCKGTQIQLLAQYMKHLPATIIKTKGFDYAQVTAGGVDTLQISPYTMESKLVNGLYFAGEIMDIDGICGGYNLQWAWSSGFLAGASAVKDNI